MAAVRLQSPQSFDHLAQDPFVGQLGGRHRAADGDAAQLQQVADEDPDDADGKVGARGEFVAARGAYYAPPVPFPHLPKHLVGALVAMDRAEAPEQEFQEALSHYLDLCTGARARPTPELAEVIALFAEQRRNRMRGPLPDPLFGGVQWIGLGEFRNRIAGKSVCLIANSGKVGESGMGAEIDGYDLVVRFNSYKIDPAHTGRRTDIHATIHKHGFNWDQPVDTRLVFGGISGDWKYSLRNRLVPGAQQYLGDESLRWPVRNIGKWGTDRWPSIPTSGFNMLFLLDFLDVSPVLDLIGFDFYESGAYRLAEAMKMPITSVHEYTSEKAWVMERAQSVSGMRISLR